MSKRVEAVRQIIHSQRSAGILPQELHMHPKTRMEFAQEAEIKPERPHDSRFTLQRLMDPSGGPEPVLRFENILVVDNELMTPGGILLRPLQLMHDPNWLATIQWAAAETRLTAQAQQDGVPQPQDGTPWHQRSPDAVQKQDGAITPEDISAGGGVNPTTVLLKAMDDLDRIEDVIVLRFYRNKSIDICSTLNQYGVVGAMQKALGHVMNGDE